MRKIKLAAVALSALLCSSACTDISEPPVPAESSTTTSAAPTETEEIKTSDTAAEQTAEQTTPPAPLIKENIDYAAFEGRIEDVARSLNVVGMGLCVFAEGEVIYSMNYGYADLEAGSPADDNTLYRSASISKMISTMVLMTLYDDGVITPYSELEPLTGFPYNNPALDKPVELWHLLTHTAGIVDGYAYENAPATKPSLGYVLSRSYSGKAPGTEYSYSNLGVGTIGGIVEQLTGEYFHDYAERMLFEPLGMDAGYCIDLIQNRDNAANLYAYGSLLYTPKSWGRTTTYYESYGLGNSYLTAQCELLITPTDLARLGIVLAGDGSVDGVRVLSEDAVNAMNKVYYADASMDFDMGLCVRVYNENFVEGRVIHGHAGQAFGCVNGLYYDPSDGTGVAICSVGCPASVNEENGVYILSDECVNTVYETFFN